MAQGGGAYGGDGVRDLIEEKTTESTLPLVPCEDTERGWLSIARERTPIRPGCASPLNLDFPASRTVRNICLLLRVHGLCYFCYSSMNGLSQGIVKVDL